MHFVYGLQPIGQPEGRVKIGFSAKVEDRISALEPGAVGERLHAIFLTEAGETHGAGRRLEKAYHDKFSLDRINREWFRFNEEMLTWVPDEGIKRVGFLVRSPASNTHQRC